MHEGEPFLVLLGDVTSELTPRLGTATAPAIDAREATAPAKAAVPPVTAWRWSRSERGHVCPELVLLGKRWAGAAARGHPHRRAAPPARHGDKPLMRVPCCRARHRRRRPHQPFVPHGLGVRGTARLTTASAAVRKRRRTGRHVHGRAAVHGQVVVMMVVRFAAFARAPVALEEPVSRVVVPV